MSAASRANHVHRHVRGQIDAGGPFNRVLPISGNGHSSENRLGSLAFWLIDKLHINGSFHRAGNHRRLGSELCEFENQIDFADGLGTWLLHKVGEEGAEVDGVGPSLPNLDRFLGELHSQRLIIEASHYWGRATVGGLFIDSQRAVFVVIEDSRILLGTTRDRFAARLDVGYLGLDPVIVARAGKDFDVGPGRDVGRPGLVFDRRGYRKAISRSYFRLVQQGSRGLANQQGGYRGR